MSLSALVTAGPTIERIDPVRYISNFSSGKQGYAIAQALAQAGIHVTLVSGPTVLDEPKGVTLKTVESAEEMLQESIASLPVDIAICSAAVCDWRPKEYSAQKLKKLSAQETLELSLVRNPDILSALSYHKKRPQLVIGFAAETECLLDHAIQKHKQKNCDWLVVNDVSEGAVFGADENQISLLKKNASIEHWPRMKKTDIATQLVTQILAVF